MGEDPTRQHSMRCPKLHGKECKCDGYLTFDELYDHRVQLFIALGKRQKKTERSDESPPISALREHRIAGAAVDVFDVEPLPVDTPCRSLDNMLATPHIGYVSLNLTGLFMVTRCLVKPI